MGANCFPRKWRRREEGRGGKKRLRGLLVTLAHDPVQMEDDDLKQLSALLEEGQVSGEF